MIAVATALVATAGCSATSGSSVTATPTSSSSSVAPATLTPTAPAPVTSSPQPGALDRYYTQRLSWRGCGGGFQCAWLLVPVDYAKPAGATLKVAVIRKRSISSHRASVILNPGGPGASGVQFERDAAGYFRSLNRHLDLVSFDPRGVGASRPIRCLSSKQLDAYFHLDLDPQSAAGRSQMLALSKAFADACAKRHGSYLAHVGTKDAARDMDVLRAALGDRRLTYYGASYGTFLGAKYAELFPTRIRALVLDGAVNPAQDTVAADIEQAGGFETNLSDFIGWCVRQGGCPLGATRSAAVAGLDRLGKRLRAHPERVGSRSLGIGEFTIGVASGFYSTSEWDQLRGALDDAMHGDGSSLLTLFDSLVDRRNDGSYTNLMESNMAINCVDRQSPTSVAGFDAVAAKARRASPHFGIDILYSSLPCAYWRVPPVEQAHPVTAPGAAPIVVVGTTHDPATPYADAQALAGQLAPSAILVTLVGSGHTAFLRGDQCINGIVETYLTRAIAPHGAPRCR